jgi:integrase
LSARPPGRIGSAHQRGFGTAGSGRRSLRGCSPSGAASSKAWSSLFILHVNALRHYTQKGDSLIRTRSSDSFFVSDFGRSLEASAVRRTFYELSRWAGLRQGEINRGPRLHDFRHRFAVQTMIQWYRSGQDVERRLPILSTYLGHAHVSDTYWYVTHCPVLMEWGVKRLESRWEVLP